MAHQITMMQTQQSSQILKSFTEQDQAKILEMVTMIYTSNLLAENRRKHCSAQLRQLLALRSQIDSDKQRQEPKGPSKEPTQGHNALNFSVKAGEVQGISLLNLVIGKPIMT